VQQLPGFQEGYFSVQDLGAQIATQLVDPKNGEYILDACSAPGGKASGLLECANIALDALEISEQRMLRVKENLARLELNANLLIGDATKPSQWWKGGYYDAIVADVPCSATGIMRRHPDILYLRRLEDIKHLQDFTKKNYHRIMETSKTGWSNVICNMFYMPQEGEDQLSWFAENLEDVLRLKCFGQLLPSEWHDGFFYGMLQKK
jgi:16S rRNA (cytosine967-C5)-methyltransferase